MQIIYLIALLFILLVAIFAVQNPIPIMLKFLVWEFQVPFVIVLISVTVVSVIIAVILGLVRQMRLRSEIRTLMSTMREMEERLKTETPPSGEQASSPPEKK